MSIGNDKRYAIVHQLTSSEILDGERLQI